MRAVEGCPLPGSRDYQDLVAGFVGTFAITFRADNETHATPPTGSQWNASHDWSVVATSRALARLTIVFAQAIPSIAVSD